MSIFAELKRRNVFRVGAAYVVVAWLKEKARCYAGFRTPLDFLEEFMVVMFGLNIDDWRAYDPYSLLDTLQPNELAIYFDSGTDDEFGFYQMALRFEKRLKELRLEHTFVSVPGGKHYDAFFGSRIPFSLEFHVEQFKQTGVYPEP